MFNHVSRLKYQAKGWNKYPVVNAIDGERYPVMWKRTHCMDACGWSATMAIKAVPGPSLVVFVSVVVGVGRTK